MSYCIHVFLLISVTVQCAKHDLPPYFPRCNIDDDKLDECILNAAKTLKPQVSKGIQEIRLPSFDPLVVETFFMNQSSNNFWYNVTFVNFTVSGLDDYDFDEIKYDPLTLVLSGKVRFHNISFVCNYDANGYFFYFPVAGKGIAEALMDSAVGTVEVKGKLSTRKQREYYLPTSTKVLMKIHGFSSHLTGLFDNNPELGHLTNDLLHINAQRVVDSGTPALELVTAGLLMRFVKTLTKFIPYNKLFSHS